MDARVKIFSERLRGSRVPTQPERRVTAGFRDRGRQSRSLCEAYNPGADAAGWIAESDVDLQSERCGYA
ncbi:hypothetical protein BH10PSE1_BH10PSE1_25120 [soil metagenome]